MNNSTQSLGSSTESPSFSTLISDAALVQSLSANGIVTPTPVQALAIPRAIAGVDLMVQAQTGSGKTLAFMLPILLELEKDPQNISTSALIITPTRELALQICGVVAQVWPQVQPACVIGGDSIDKQIKCLRRDKRIVVGTPGRLLDLINQRELLLRRCRQFVLDEADEMLSMGFLEDVQSILKRLPTKRQGMFFSATLSPRVAMLAQSFLHQPETIEVEKNEQNTPAIKHLFCRVSGGVADKAKSLCNVLEQENATSAIIFCNTKSDTELVEVFMRRRGFNAQRINSDLSQKERVKVLNGLRDGTLRYLIATDVAARGIDISHLELVVNYSIHSDSEAYVHRTGRTGRAGRSGVAISLVAPQDNGAFYGLQRSLGIPFEEIPCPTGETAPPAGAKEVASA
jgi:ATP-dependent RNA helicase DeaD